MKILKIKCNFKLNINLLPWFNAYINETYDQISREKTMNRCQPQENSHVEGCKSNNF